MNRTFILVITLLLYSCFSLASQESKVIKYHTDIDVDKGILHKKIAVTIKISKRKDDYYGNVSIPYTGKNKIKSLKAWVSDYKGKTVRKLKKRDITESSAVSSISLYEDDMVKSFKLRHNTYPYYINYEYTVQLTDYFVITNWYPLIYSRLDVDDAVLSVNIKNGTKIRVSEKGEFVKDSVKTEFGILYSWRKSNVEKVERETMSENIYSELSSINIVPLSFQYGEYGENKTWATFGDWLYRLGVNQRDLTDKEKSTIDKLTLGLDTDAEKVVTMYNYLQDNMRYINVSIDVGGLKPYPASYVCKNKYGDCKALSNYMKAVFDYVGIESYYTVINAGENAQRIDTENPSQQFNHVVVMLPMKGDTTWLECTSNSLPAGYVSDFIQDRKALVVDSEGKSKLVNTPKLTEEDVLCRSTTEIDLNDFVNTTVRFRAVYRGDDFDYLSYIVNNSNDDRKKEIVKRYLPFKNFDINKWSLDRGNRKLDSITINSNLVIKKYVKRYGDISVAQIPMLDVYNCDPVADREHDIYINIPECQSDSIIFKYAENMQIEYPDNVDIKSEFGHYTMQVDTIDNKVVVNRDYFLYAGKYSVKKYKEFYNFIQNIKKQEKKNKLILKVK